MTSPRSDAGTKLVFVTTEPGVATRNARFSLALGASVVAHAAMMLVAVGVPAKGATTEPIHRLRDAFRASTVEVGTLPDAVRPSGDGTPERAAEPPEPAPPVEHARAAPTTAQDRAPNADDAMAPVLAPPPAPERSARPRVPAKSPSRSNSAPSTSAEPSAAIAPASSIGRTVSESAGSFGALGLPPGTQYFARAFARALPVVLGDTAWQSLPLGAAGEASLDISIDEGGRISKVELDPLVATPAILKRAIDRAFVLLNAGTFSLDGTRVQMGMERLALSVALSQVEKNPDDGANPNLMNEKGHRPPTRERPGSSHLTFNSGRRVDVTIRMRPPGE